MKTNTATVLKHPINGRTVSIQNYLSTGAAVPPCKHFAAQVQTRPGLASFRYCLPHPSSQQKPLLTTFLNLLITINIEKYQITAHKQLHFPVFFGNIISKVEYYRFTYKVTNIFIVIYSILSIMKYSKNTIDSYNRWYYGQPSTQNEHIMEKIWI